ncbi:hypothetical protein L6452_33210 [Arctium lappa]|uniref:Uncharacterized protein n=1 Tax=Arctium lappa TaxID=4217 RepID=A0ACB8Z7W0_ARCLA|nr:hypothetical protein L6452_33210 [Arctium lappa]
MSAFEVEAEVYVNFTNQGATDTRVNPIHVIKQQHHFIFLGFIFFTNSRFTKTTQKDQSLCLFLYSILGSQDWVFVF